MLSKFKAYELAVQYYSETKKLKVPKFLKDQLMRASSSIALNLAESSGKGSGPDQRRFYSIALGSLRECEAILRLEKIEDPGIASLQDQLGAIIYTLCKVKTESRPGS